MELLNKEDLLDEEEEIQTVLKKIIFFKCSHVNKK